MLGNGQGGTHVRPILALSEAEPSTRPPADRGLPQRRRPQSRGAPARYWRTASTNSASVSAVVGSSTTVAWSTPKAACAARPRATSAGEPESAGGESLGAAPG